jgi:hypothetical protein
MRLDTLFGEHQPAIGENWAPFFDRAANERTVLAALPALPQVFPASCH